MHYRAEYFKERLFRGFSWSLFWTAALIAGFGVIAIFSASKGMPSNYALKQVMWLVIAHLALFAVVWVGYRRILGFSYAFYAFTLILLLYVIFMGATRFGAQRWIAIGPFALQPSELAKIATILTLAQYLGDRARNRYATTRFLAAFLIAAVPIGLIVRQPDLGTSLVFLPILFCILFVWGVKLRFLIMPALCALCSMPIFWMLLKPYQRNRILTFVNPDADPLGAGYTAIQSKIAVGSGGFVGKGFLHGTQNQLDFLPQHHTDFIFCVVAEEAGFLGTMLVLFLFALLFMGMLRVIERTTDVRGRLIATGIMAMTFFHVLINIGMTVGWAPITGLPLPFFSYGGSSLLTMYISVGLLISIYKERSFF